jgi:hypothetical protein
MSTRSESGQASVELVALIPLIVAFGAVLIQAGIAGQAIWLSQSAARAAARAQAVGGDSVDAARRALPARLEHGLRVRGDREGTVSVRIEIPALTGGALTKVTGSARMVPQR